MHKSVQKLYNGVPMTRGSGKILPMPTAKASWITKLTRGVSILLLATGGYYLLGLALHHSN
ncbi:MAG: hypothetical protein RRY29_04300 [Desulfovibrionaceae bacterium]